MPSLRVISSALFAAIALQFFLLLPHQGICQDSNSELVPPDVTVPAQNYPGSGSPVNITPPPAAAASQSDPVAIINTNKGVITIRLFRKYAPNTVASFMDLVQKGFYNGLRWHRVEPGFCIQGGCPKGDGTGVYIEPATNRPRFLNLETSPHLRHNAPGVVAMAHFSGNDNTSSCQFYITLSPQPSLDNHYSIFGGVINGMDVVRQIAIGDKILGISVAEQP